MNKILNEMIDDTAKSTNEFTKKDFESYLVEKAKKVLREFDADSAIKFVGDDVEINGKKVGTVPLDLNKFETQAITFVSNDGKIRKEFEDAGELYNFLATTYNVE